MTRPSLKQLTELAILDREEQLANENIWLEEMQKYVEKENCKEKVIRRYESYENLKN